MKSISKLLLLLGLCLPVQVSLPAGEYYRCPGQKLKYQWLKLAERHCSDPQVCYTALREKPEIYDMDPYDRRLISHPTMETVELCGQVYPLEYQKMKRLNNNRSPDLNPTESAQAIALQQEAQAKGKPVDAPPIGAEFAADAQRLRAKGF